MQTKLPETYPCPLCGKIISADEYVVNWGACSDCFDKDYEKYLEEQKMKLDKPNDEE